MKTLKNLTSLMGYEVVASDSSTGYADDFLIDDMSWKVRYIRLNMGSRRLGGRALISPLAITKIDYEKENIHLNIPREVIRTSPHWDAKMPILLSHELKLHKHYGWKFSATHESLITHLTALKDAIADENKDNHDVGILYDRHLQSASDLIGMRVVLKEGQYVGKVIEYAIDDATWSIPFLMMKLRNGKMSVLDPLEIERFDIREKTVFTTLTDKKMEELPQYRAGHTAIVCVENLQELEQRLVHNERKTELFEEMCT